MNGNDIIDLNLATIPGGSKRSRFLEKMFCPSEQEIINSTGIGIWTVWAMKEAVYKAHHRKFNLPRSFSPKSIKVHIREYLDKWALTEAEYMGFKYEGKVDFTSDYIHCTATCLPQELVYSEIHYTSPEHVKSLLKNALSEKLGITKEALHISKDQYYIPHLFYKNFNLNIPFSISHHGNYAAFSFQLINY